MPYYAQLAANGTCCAVTETYGVIDAPHMIELPAYDTGLIGCVYDAATKTFAAPVPAVPAVPQTVSAFQAYSALTDFGYMPAVEQIMAHPDTPTKAKLAWQKARDFERDSETVLLLAGVLGISASELDKLFTYAATVKG